MEWGDCKAFRYADGYMGPELSSHLGWKYKNRGRERCTDITPERPLLSPRERVHPGKGARTPQDIAVYQREYGGRIRGASKGVKEQHSERKSRERIQGRRAEPAEEGRTSTIGRPLGGVQDAGGRSPGVQAISDPAQRPSGMRCEYDMR